MISAITYWILAKIEIDWEDMSAWVSLIFSLPFIVGLISAAFIDLSIAHKILLWAYSN